GAQADQEGPQEPQVGTRPATTAAVRGSPRGPRTVRRCAGRFACAGFSRRRVGASSSTCPARKRRRVKWPLPPITNGAHVQHPDLPAEQEHLDEVYSHLGAARRRDQEALRKVMLDDDPEPQARVEREVEYQRLQANLERYRHAEVGLVFGRIDIADDEP